MTSTANLSLPMISAAQAQKHVTHNEALEHLDALVQLSAIAVVTEPPAQPGEGDRYICADGAIGEFAGHAGEIASFQGGGWVFHVPRIGWRCWLQSQSALKVHDGADWVDAAPGGGGGSVDFQNVPLLGVNATADASNRLSVSSANTLLNHEGSDHRLKINRAAPADTVSLVFQSNFAGRTEMAIAGDDRFRIKVSADGSNWADAVEIEPDTGRLKSVPADMRGNGLTALIEQTHPDEPLLMPAGFSGYTNTPVGTSSPGWRFKIPFYFPHDMSVSKVTYVVKSAGAPGAMLRIGLRRWDRMAGWSFRELLFETGEVVADVAATHVVNVGPHVVPAGWYVLDVANNDATIKLLGQTWANIAQPAFGARIVNGAMRAILCLVAYQPYGPLPADDPGVTYVTANEAHGNFCIGLS